MRKLASIQTILDIQAIDGADMICVATIKGWKAVVKKNEFNIDDKVIYIEYDSILPERHEFEFMRSKKFKVKTVKLKKQISQGLVFPLSLLPVDDYEIDQDVTNLLGITKYEAPIPTELQGQAKGNFPDFIPKTDETRIQNCQDVLTLYKDKLFVLTEKIDGSSITVYYKDGTFGVCSRNIDFKLNEENENNAYIRTIKHLGIEGKLKRNIAIQGELYGSKIQSNKYKLNEGELKIKFFKAWNIDEQKYLSFQEFKYLMDKLELETVPILSTEVLGDDIDALVLKSYGSSKLNPNTIREGIVAYLKYPDNYLHQVSFKIINLEFLLKYND